MGFGDFSFGAEMRDTITKMIENTIDRVRPKYRYGVVQEASPSTMKVNVLMNGDLNPVWVNLSSVIPSVGQTVRIEGQGTDRYVAGVVPRAGEFGPTEGAIELPAGTDLNDIVTPGRYLIQLAAASGVYNWPGMGIPNYYTADANNSSGSVSVARSGHLTVTKLDHRIIQRADIYMSLGQAQAITMQRLRWAGAWSVWKIQNGPYTARNGTHVRDLGRMTSPGPNNPVEIVRTDYHPPLRINTQNGVTWSRADRTPEWSTSWLAPALQGAWVNYGGGYETFGVVRTSAGIVSLKGLVRAGGLSADLIATLPEGYRPAGKLMFSIPGANNTTGSRIDVDPNGEVKFTAGSSNSSSHVSLSGIQFPAADVAPNSAWTPITIAGGWSAYGSPWPDPSYWQDEYGRVWFRGMVARASVPTSEQQFGSIPAALGPERQIHLFGCASSSLFFSWHITAAGLMVFKPGGGATTTYLSLCNACIMPGSSYPASSTADYAYLQGWSAYSSSFPPAGMRLFPDGLIHLTGLIKGGTTSGAILSAMAENFRKGRGTDIYMIASNNAPARLDVGGTSSVSFLSGSPLWMSLDGIIFLQEG